MRTSVWKQYYALVLMKLSFSFCPGASHWFELGRAQLGRGDVAHFSALNQDFCHVRMAVVGFFASVTI